MTTAVTMRTKGSEVIFTQRKPPRKISAEERNARGNRLPVISLVFRRSVGRIFHAAAGLFPHAEILFGVLSGCNLCSGNTSGADELMSLAGFIVRMDFMAYLGNHWAV